MTPDLAWWKDLASFLIAQTALIVGAAIIVNFKIRGAQARRSVWQAALLGFACIWVGELAGAGEQTRTLWPRQSTIVVNMLTPPVTVSPVRGTTAPLTPKPQTAPVKPRAPVEWPGEIWLTGMGLLLLWTAANRIWLAWQRRKMAPADMATQETVRRLSHSLGLRRVEARTWPRLRGPVAFGWWRPTVALPDDFPTRYCAAQREAMLAHELAHLAARDPGWLLLTDIVCALAWWNPLAWIGARQLRDACETAADEASALVPAGALALAESLLRFGRELVESPMIHGLGVAGSGLRSALGRRVKALLASPGTWRGLSPRWRWWPRVVMIIFALLATWVPVWTSPSGSLVGWLVQSASADTRPNSPPMTYSFDDSFRSYFGAEGEKSADSAFRRFSTNADSAASQQTRSNLVTLTFHFVNIPERSPAQAELDKLFTELAPDESAGPEAVAQFLQESKITHTENFHVDYHLTRDRIAKLTNPEFKKTWNSIQKSAGTEILSTPSIKNFVGKQGRIGVENIQDVVTAVAPPGKGNVPGATNGFSTETLHTGIVADAVAGKAADGWDLSVLCRLSQFIGYDNPGKGTPVIPLPRVSVDDIQAKASLPAGQTLLLRGPARTQTNKITDTVLGIFHSTHVSVVHNRLYVFVTPMADTNPPPSAPR